MCSMLSTHHQSWSSAIIWFEVIILCFEIDKMLHGVFFSKHNEPNGNPGKSAIDASCKTDYLVVKDNSIKRDILIGSDSALNVYEYINFVQIPDATNDPVQAANQNVVIAGVQRLCGRFFNTASATISVEICSKFLPTPKYIHISAWICLVYFLLSFFSWYDSFPSRFCHGSKWSSNEWTRRKEQNSSERNKWSRAPDRARWNCGIPIGLPSSRLLIIKLNN